MRISAIPLVAASLIWITACGGGGSGPGQPAPPANQAPLATDVVLRGSFRPETVPADTLTASYQYTDNENDPEGETEIRWYRDGELIDGESNPTFTAREIDVGTAIHFEVTPIATTGTARGTPTASDPIRIRPVTVFGRTLFQDLNGNDQVDQGDQLRIAFNTAIETDSDGVLDLALTNPADSFGTGAAISTSYFPTELLVTLGANPRVALGPAFPQDTPGSESGVNIATTASGRIRSTAGIQAQAAEPIPFHPSFDPAQSLSVIQPSRDLALADIDQDGDLDLITAMQNFNPGDSPRNRVYRNTGGQFSLIASLGNSATESIALVDTDGDGDLDIVAANSDEVLEERRPNRIYLNDGAGGFSDSGQRLGSNVSTTVATGDLNGDGLIDLVFANAGDDRVYLNDGQGNFSPGADSLYADRNSSLLLADLDSDGDLDVATGHYTQTDPDTEAYEGSVLAYFNSGEGRFGEAVTLASHPVTSLAADDLDGDGDIDLVSVSPFSLTSALLLRNSGSGEFASEDLSDQTGGLRAYLTDIDTDGDSDLITVGCICFDAVPETIVDVLLNDGNADFSERWASYLVFSSSPIASGDIDEDGDIDLIFGGERNQIWSNSMSVRNP